MHTLKKLMALREAADAKAKIDAPAIFKNVLAMLGEYPLSYYAVSSIRVADLAFAYGLNVKERAGRYRISIPTNDEVR